MTSQASALAGRRSVPFLVLVSIGILLTSLALGFRVQTVRAGQPQAPAPECLQPLDVVFIIDRSGSMGDETGISSGNRLDQAVAAAENFVDTLENNGGVGGSGLHQVGLVSYGGTSASVNAQFDSGTSQSDFNTQAGLLSPSGNTPLKQGMAAGLGELGGSDRRDTVDGKAVTHVYVLLSDGRPWPDPTNRPNSTEIGNYLGAADLAYSIQLGQTPANPPNGAYILDPVLMENLAKPHGTVDGNNADTPNFFKVLDADDLTDVFQGIVNSLLCGDVQIEKEADPTSLPNGGGEVTYTYHVSHIQKDGLPFSDVSVTDDQCKPVDYVSGDDGDGLLEFGETWEFSCTATITKDTTNTACVAGEYVGSGGVTIPEGTICAKAEVTVEPPPPDAPDIDIEKSNNADGTVPPGTEVKYTYDVTNTGNTALGITALTDLIWDSDTVACDLSKAVPDEDAGDDEILSPDETWTFHCSTKLEVTTRNEACVEAVVVVGVPTDLNLLVAPQTVKDCDDNNVPVGSPEGSVGGGTGTPAPSIPNTAIGQLGFGGPLATVIFGVILLASLGTLAYANVRSARERR